VETTGPAVSIATVCQTISDITVVNVELRDKKGRYVPDACPDLTLKVGGSGHIIGAGNGDPAYLGPDNPGVTDCKSFTIPAFNGRAQFIVQGEPGSLTVVK
jgi:beta-galactosidase